MPARGDSTIDQSNWSVHVRGEHYRLVLAILVWVVVKIAEHTFETFVP